MSTPDTRCLVAKLWNHCDVLSNDGVSTIDYLEQLTHPPRVWTSKTMPREVAVVDLVHGPGSSGWGPGG